VTWCVGISCPISCVPTRWAHQRMPRGRAWASLLRSTLPLYDHRSAEDRLIVRADWQGRAAEAAGRHREARAFYEPRAKRTPFFMARSASSRPHLHAAPEPLAGASSLSGSCKFARGGKR